VILGDQVIDMNEAAKARVESFNEAPPPISELVSRTRIRHRRRAKLVATVSAIVVFSGAAALVLSRPHSGSRVSVSRPQSRKTFSMSEAKSAAESLLNKAVLPTDARRTKTIPAAGLSSPPIQFGCSPVADVHEFWQSPSPVEQIVSFFEHHVPQGLTLTGSGGIPNGEVEYLMEAPTAQYFDSRYLLISFTPSFPSSTGIRVDGVAIPSTSTCITHG